MGTPQRVHWGIAESTRIAQLQRMRGKWFKASLLDGSRRRR
jgi:hypothetical protein